MQNLQTEKNRKKENRKTEKNNFIYVKYKSKLKTSSIYAIIPIEL